MSIDDALGALCNGAVVPIGLGEPSPRPPCSGNSEEPSAGRTSDAARSGVGGVGVITWLRLKLAEAESALRAREQMAQTLRSGTDESWEAAAKLHPSTAGVPFRKTERLKAANAQARISVRCLRDVEMLKLLLKLLGGGGAEQVAENGTCETWSGAVSPNVQGQQLRSGDASK